jgi:hypothetical protein
MNKMLKVMAISVITALFLALPLMAQVDTTSEAPAGDPSSNQRGATATLYKSDVDNYLSVNNYSTVNFEKWFGFLHGYAHDQQEWRGHLGFATNVGGLYLGLRYNGNIFQDTSSGEGETVTLTKEYNPDTQELVEFTETTTYGERWHNSTNQLDILIGVANQGIRVGFYESMAINPNEVGTDGSGNSVITKTDSQDGFVTYSMKTDEFSEFGGWMRPSLQWGTLLNVGNLTVKPRVGAAFGIFQNKLINNYYENYETYNGTPTTTATSKNNTLYRDGHNNGILRPEFKVGADIVLPKTETLTTTVTIDYTMKFDIYDNDYSASGFSGTAKGLVSWEGASTTTNKAIDRETTTTAAHLYFSDKTGFYHSIAPRLTLDKSVADGLNVGLAILAPFSITMTSEDGYDENKEYSVIKVYRPITNAESKTVTEFTEHNYGKLTETTGFAIDPSVRLGAKYALIPGRFSVNAGIQLDPLAYRYRSEKITPNGNGIGLRTTSKTTDGDGVVTEKKDSADYDLGQEVSSSVEHKWDFFNGQVGGGFVFNFNENAALDLWVNSGDLNQDWNLNVTTVNVMVVLKF